MPADGDGEREERFACNMNALTKAERARHQAILGPVLRAIESRTELPDGYAFRLPRTVLPVVEEWMALERRCCPFFSLRADVPSGDAPILLSITGPAGVKAFILAEFGL